MNWTFDCTWTAREVHVILGNGTFLLLLLCWEMGVYNVKHAGVGVCWDGMEIYQELSNGSFWKNIVEGYRHW